MFLQYDPSPYGLHVENRGFQEPRRLVHKSLSMHGVVRAEPKKVGEPVIREKIGNEEADSDDVKVYCVDESKVAAGRKVL